MEAIVVLIVVIVIWASRKASIETKLDNYDMSKVDTVKLSSDAAKGVSVAERRRRCVNGY